MAFIIRDNFTNSNVELTEYPLCVMLLMCVVVSTLGCAPPSLFGGSIIMKQLSYKRP